MSSPDPNNEADRAVIEGGGGESEGFELAEQALIENASHGDQHAARRIAQDAFPGDGATAVSGEADGEWTSERPADER